MSTCILNVRGPRDSPIQPIGHRRLREELIVRTLVGSGVRAAEITEMYMRTRRFASAATWLMVETHEELDSRTYKF